MFGGQMALSRLDVAARVAHQELDALLVAGTNRERFRPYGRLRVEWVLRGGERPAGRYTEFMRSVVVEAVNVGLEHAYGDSHRSEIDPQVYRRRDARD